MQIPPDERYKDSASRLRTTSLPKLISRAYKLHQTIKRGTFTISVFRGPSSETLATNNPVLVWAIIVDSLNPIPLLHENETTFRANARNITRFEATHLPNLEAIASLLANKRELEN